MAFNISEKIIGHFNHETVIQYTITNSNGMQLSVLNYGATISSILTADKTGYLGDVVLGYNSFEGYLQKGNPYFGCLVGRFANRIADGRFTINGQNFTLAANNNGNALHGGITGFDKVMWKVDAIDNNSLLMSYLSENGEEGYPGNLHTHVTYTLSDDNEVRIEYKAETDQPTPVNLTNHSYFNLSAGADTTIKDHILTIHADQIIEVNERLIPTGKLVDVEGTAMDFNNEKLIGEDLLKVEGGGFDHSWVLNNGGNIHEAVAIVYHPASGRCLEVFTTEPGLQFYSANFLDGTLQDTKDGKVYIKHSALCLEAQHFPDSPNQPSFPNTVLNPGEIYNQVTIYKFSVR